VIQIWNCDLIFLVLEVVEMDPTCYEWHYTLGNWMRQQRRRDAHAPFSTLGEDEMKVLWETYEKCDYPKQDADGKNSRMRNRALAGVLQGLAEILRNRSFAKTDRNNRNSSLMPMITFGDLKFKTDEEAKCFIVSEIDRYFFKLAASV
jgi:hypothetical protein